MKAIAALLAMVMSALAGSGVPGPAAVRFLEKVREKKVNLEPGGDTALAPQTTESKRQEITRRLQRMAQDIGNDPLVAGSEKIDGDLAAVLVRKSGGLDSDLFQIFPVALVKHSGAWVAAPVPASFENSGAGFESSVRARISALEDWMLRQQTIELENLRNQSMAKLREDIEKALPSLTLAALDSKQVGELFLSACEKRDLSVMLGILGGASPTLPDDWGQRLRAVNAAVNAAGKVVRPWRLLISKDVIRVPVAHEESGDEATFTLACLDPAGKPPNFTKARVELLELNLSRRPGGHWQFDPSQDFLLYPPPKPEMPTDQPESDLLNLFSSKLALLHPASPAPTSTQARDALLAALKHQNPSSLANLIQFPDDPSAARDACAAAARIWWDCNDPPSSHHLVALADHPLDDQAACALQLFSIHRPDQFNLKILYFVKSGTGWLWEPNPSKEILSSFQEWAILQEKEWRKQWQQTLLANCLELDEIPNTDSPSEDEARILMTSWIAATRAGDLEKSIHLTARFKTPESSVTLLRNLGYEINDALNNPATPSITGIHRDKTWTAVGTNSNRPGTPAFPCYPIIRTPDGPKILLEFDLIASDNRSREYLNKIALERLRKSHPDAAAALKKLFSDHCVKALGGERP